MWAYIDKHYRTTPEVIAAKLAELQHAPGVTPYMGSDYRVHYRRADGARVPERHEVAALVLAGHDHDITPDNVLQLLAAL